MDATNPTYPNPILLTGESNKLYLFFRNGVANTQSYVTSTDLWSVSPASIDGGALGATPTWSSEVQLTASAGTQGIYTKLHSNGVDRIDILMTDAIDASSGSGQKNDVRHGYYIGGNWYTSAGVSLGAVGTLISFTTFTAVATSGAPDNFGNLWCWHMQRRASGAIEVLFARFPTVPDHRYYYARWNGSAWSKIEIDAGNGSGTPDTRSSQIADGAGSTQGHYSPGLYLDTVNEGVVYCAVGNSVYSVLYRYTTPDFGASWSRQRVSGMIKENVRPFVPVGRTTKYAVLWASGDYHFYDFNAAPDTSYGYATLVNAASRGYAVGTAAPANAVAPVISGTAQSGQVLSATQGTWTGDWPLTFTYQWSRDGVDLGGATSSTYTVVSGDVGHLLTCRVTATNSLGSASSTSAGASGLPANLLTKTEQINLWTLSSMTLSADVAANPVNGSVTADRPAEQTGSTSHSVTCPVAISFVNATTYTYSFYVKFESRQFIQLLFGAAAFGVNAYANFDIQNGSVQTVGSAAAAAIVSAGSGWYRISMTATSSAGASAPASLFFVQAGNSVRAQSYTGVATNTALAFGAQVETGSVANTYIPVA